MYRLNICIIKKYADKETVEVIRYTCTCYNISTSYNKKGACPRSDWQVLPPIGQRQMEYWKVTVRSFIWRAYSLSNLSLSLSENQCLQSPTSPTVGKRPNKTLLTVKSLRFTKNMLSCYVYTYSSAFEKVYNCTHIFSIIHQLR